MNKQSIIITIVAFAMATTVNAQFSIGPKLGVNFNSINSKYSTEYRDPGVPKPSNSGSTRGQIGLVAQIELADHLYLRPELDITAKGGKIEWHEMENGEDYTYKQEFTNGFIEIPINVAYGFPVGDHEIQISGGPYFAFGIAGILHEEKLGPIVNIQGTQVNNPYTDDYQVRFKKIPSDFNSIKENDVYMNGLDVGLNVGAAFKLSSGLAFMLNYGLGLSNFQPKFEEVPDGYDRKKDDIYKYRVFSLSVFWLFGGN